MNASPNARVELLIGDLIRRNAQAVPGRVAASLGAAALTHASSSDAASRIGWALRERGVARGERVLACADTSLEVLALFAGAAKLGAVFAPLDARLGARARRACWRRSRARTGSSPTPPRLDAARSVAARLGARVAALGRLGDVRPRERRAARAAPRPASSCATPRCARPIRT